MSFLNLCVCHCDTYPTLFPNTFVQNDPGCVGGWGGTMATTEEQTYTVRSGTGSRFDPKKMADLFGENHQEIRKNVSEKKLQTLFLLGFRLNSCLTGYHEIRNTGGELDAEIQQTNLISVNGGKYSLFRIFRCILKSNR